MVVPGAATCRGCVGVLLFVVLFFTFATASTTIPELAVSPLIPEACGNATDCTSCTANASCGWCVSLNKCIAGNETGPENGGCLVWNYETCPVDQCERHTSCLDCALAGGCGWCNSLSSQAVCVSGNSTGPYAANAQCPIWDWGPMSCDSSKKCADYTTCETCTNDTNCGYCYDGANPQCMAGNNTLPYEGQCAKWSYGATCQDIFCYRLTDCGSCTKSPVCGWCNETETCMPGGQSGPNSGTCGGDNKWFFGKCPILPVKGCGALKNCSSCVEDPQCGWCEDSNICYHIDSEPDNCTYFRVGSCRDPCRDKKSCYSCSSDSLCGWCNSSVCVSGQNGPVTGQCNVWEKVPDSCNNTACTDYLTCDACTQPSNKNCAWCEYTRPARCLHIADPPPQPGDPTCPYNWYYGHCPAPVDCRDYAECKECTTLHCWWCGSNGCRDNKLFQNCFQTTEMCDPIPPHNSSDSGLSAGQIAGIVIGSVAGALLFVALLGFAWYRFYWLRKHYYEVLR